MANSLDVHRYSNIFMDDQHIHGNGISHWWIFVCEMGVKYHCEKVPVSKDKDSIRGCGRSVGNRAIYIFAR